MIKPIAETHAHLSLDSVNYNTAIRRHLANPCEEHIRSALESYSNAGVTYLRDGGDHLGVALRAREISGEYGIKIVCPAFPIHRKGYYGSILGRAYDSLASYRVLVAEAKKQGADFIKLFASGLLDFSVYGRIMQQGPMEDDEAKEMVKIAHGEGLSVMAHANGGERAAMLIQAGIDSIEHGYYLGKDTLDLLAGSNCCWVPTLAPVGNIIDSGAFEKSVLEKIYYGQLEAVAYGIEEGAIIAPGSDAGAYLVSHGSGIADEWAHLSNTGVDHAALENCLCEGEKFIIENFKRK
ncbi:MAG: amidohydrolase family protein [Eubacteriaceae bacterium]|nr:amidohydrolase family protein [Eubacteriaceae bacterium]